MIGPERAPCAAMVSAARASSSPVVTPGRTAASSTRSTSATAAPARRRPSSCSGVSIDTSGRQARLLEAVVAGDEGGVAAAAGQQLVVGAALDDLAAGRGRRSGRRRGRWRAGARWRRGAALGEVVERLLHGALGAGVEGAGGLVEEQDGRVAQDRPGDRDALLLAAGEPVAALADDGVVALGQRGDEVVDARGAGRVLDLGVGRRRAGRSAGSRARWRGRGRSPGRPRPRRRPATRSAGRRCPCRRSVTRPRSGS